MTEYKCRECGKIYTKKDILTALRPFDKEEIIWGCPDCQSIDSFDDICDEPGCKKIAKMYRILTKFLR